MQKSKKHATHKQEKKNQSIDTDSEMRETIELTDKDVKIAIINMFHMFKTVEENINMRMREMEGIKKQIKLQI